MKRFAICLVITLMIATLLVPAFAETAAPTAETTIETASDTVPEIEADPVAEPLEAPAVVTAEPAPTTTFAVDLTQVVVSVIGLIFSFLLTWLIRTIVPPLKKWLEARTTAQQREMICNLVRQLVNAAEQTIGSGKGAEKLEYVVKRMEKAGYTVDLDIIESAVKEMNDKAVQWLVDSLEIKEAGTDSTIE